MKLRPHLFADRLPDVAAYFWQKYGRNVEQVDCDKEDRIAYRQLCADALEKRSK